MKLKEKHLSFFNFMGILETDQLQVSQVEGSATKNHHEFDEVLTELKLSYGATSITKKRKASENYGNLCCKIVESQITKIDCENILGLRKVSKLTIRTKKINPNEN